MYKTSRLFPFEVDRTKMFKKKFDAIYKEFDLLTGDTVSGTKSRVFP